MITATYNTALVVCIRHAVSLTVYAENVNVPDRVDVATEVLGAGKDVDRLEERLVVPESVERVHQIAVFLRRQTETKGS